MIRSAESSYITLNQGDVFGILSGIFWGIGATYVKKWPKLRPSSIACVQFGVAAVVPGCLALIFFDISIPGAENLIKGMPVALICSIFFILPTMFLVLWISQILYPGRIGILMVSEIIIAIISAALSLPEETLKVIQWLGAILIIAAALFEVLGNEGHEFLDKNTPQKF